MWLSPNSKLKNSNFAPPVTYTDPAELVIVVIVEYVWRGWIIIALGSALVSASATINTSTFFYYLSSL